jgi:hypothetical protein
MKPKSSTKQRERDEGERRFEQHRIKQLRIGSELPVC